MRTRSFESLTRVSHSWPKSVRAHSQRLISRVTGDVVLGRFHLDDNGVYQGLANNFRVADDSLRMQSCSVQQFVLSSEREAQHALRKRF
jgi:hypothetical protein